MRRKVLWSGALLLAFVPASGALDNPQPDKAATPKEQYDAILKEYAQKQTEFMKSYQQAKTDEERRKLLESRPSPEPYAKQFLEIGEKNPKDAVAVDALLWVVQNLPRGKEADQAIALLAQDHVASPKVGQLAMLLGQLQTPSAERLLRAVLEKNPDRSAQGQACLALAQVLKGQAELNQRRKMPGADQLLKQAEEFFERVVKEYGDVKVTRNTLGETAKSELFELRNLAIGKTVPEIEAEDIDGKAFKLSDYRGKVVLLDFWGHW
jgi:hypothetical protein